MKARPITISEVHSFDVRDLVQVPLGRSGLEATVDYDDYQELLALGLSPNWCLTGGNVVTRKDGNLLTVARIIVDAQPGEIVAYSDGDRTNLRRGNLVLKSGYSINADRRLLTTH